MILSIEIIEPKNQNGKLGPKELTSYSKDHLDNYATEFNNRTAFSVGLVLRKC